VYAKESSNLHRALREVPLQQRFASSSPAVIVGDAKEAHVIKQGEIIEILDGPTEEKVEPVLRFRGRSLQDGADGWMTFREKNFKTWSGRYKCVAATALQSVFTSKEGQLIRKLDIGEFVDVLEGPKEDESVRIFRVRARAEKDGATGWATIRGNGGTSYLVPHAG